MPACSSVHGTLWIIRFFYVCKALGPVSHKLKQSLYRKRHFSNNSSPLAMALRFKIQMWNTGVVVSLHLYAYIPFEVPIFGNSGNIAAASDSSGSLKRWVSCRIRPQIRSYLSWYLMSLLGQNFVCHSPMGWFRKSLHELNSFILSQSYYSPTVFDVIMLKGWSRILFA